MFSVFQLILKYFFRVFLSNQSKMKKKKKSALFFCDVLLQTDIFNDEFHEECRFKPTCRSIFVWMLIRRTIKKGKILYSPKRSASTGEPKLFEKFPGVPTVPSIFLPGPSAGSSPRCRSSPACPVVRRRGWGVPGAPSHRRSGLNPWAGTCWLPGHASTLALGWHQCSPAWHRHRHRHWHRHRHRHRPSRAVGKKQPCKPTPAAHPHEGRDVGAQPLWRRYKGCLA